MIAVAHRYGKLAYDLVQSESRQQLHEYGGYCMERDNHTGRSISPAAMIERNQQER